MGSHSMLMTSVLRQRVIDQTLRPALPVIFVGVNGSRRFSLTKLVVCGWYKREMYFNYNYTWAAMGCTVMLGCGSAPGWPGGGCPG